MSAINFRKEKDFLRLIKEICDNILLKNGPFLKEGIYQEVLFHELAMLQLLPKREVVFGGYFLDSKEKQVFIGNGQSLRSDIELPFQKCILELKSLGNDTKEENIWQLRNYLEQRPDMNYGIVINFVSKFGKREGNTPFVQYDMLVRTGEYYEEDKQKINKYYHYGPITSKPYPNRESIFIREEENQPV